MRLANASAMWMLEMNFLLFYFFFNYIELLNLSLEWEQVLSKFSLLCKSQFIVEIFKACLSCVVHVQLSFFEVKYIFHHLLILIVDIF